MKKLYLLRHADALPITINKDGSITEDYERSLSVQGKNEVIELAKTLPEDFFCDVVLSSTATRTRETWHILSTTNKYCFPTHYHQELYNPSMENMVDIIKHLDEEYNSVCVISHNPAISELAIYLTGKETMFHTCNIKLLELDIKSWRKISCNSGKLIFSLTDACT